MTLNKEFSFVQGRFRPALLGFVLFCAFAASAVAQPAPATGPGGPPASGMASPIGLVLQDTPLGVVLKLIADQAGQKLETHVPLNDVVSVDLQGETLESAMQKVLAGKPYMWAQDGGTIHVFKGWNPPEVAQSVPTAAPIPEKPRVTRLFPLKKRKVDGVVSLLSRLGNKDVNIVADPPTNSLILVGTEEQIQVVASLALEIDEAPVTVEIALPEEIVSESFSLEYITDFSELEKSLNKILYGESILNDPAQNPERAAQVQDQIMAASQILDQSKPQEPRKEFFLLDKVRRILVITAARSKLEMIREYFRKVNTPISQVLIEAHIVALEDGADRSLGINWNAQEQWGAIYSDPNRRQNTLTTNTGNTGTQIGGGFYFGRWDLSNVTSVLRAVEDKGRGQILSQPRLMTLSGKEAEINISTQYPYKSSVTMNQTGTTQNVQFVNAGIILTVTPQVNVSAGSIVMKVDPVVSDLVSLSADGPIVTQRKASTNVEVRNGETVVIGGLLRDESIRDTKVVPLLSKIPVLGEFFRFSQKKKKRTNLMILITPRIITVNSPPEGKPPELDSAFPSITGKPVHKSPPPVPENRLPEKPHSEYQDRLDALRSKYLEKE